MTEKKWTYSDAGVDVEKAEKLVGDFKKMAYATQDPRVLKGIGGFSALYDAGNLGIEDPVLVSCTDGVGTKLKLAFEMDCHNTVGIDLVAMCVNDLITAGARPLFFLDYFATGKLSRQSARAVVQGIADGCRLSGCALVGGETAEMPGFYPEGEYDLAGFCVGIVSRSKIIDGSGISEGDAIIGLSSTGVHSNGFSLVRKAVLEKAGRKLDERLDHYGKTLGEVLLTPTAIYVDVVRELCEKFQILGLANITGGGLESNINRVMPDGLKCQIDYGSWPVPEIFHYIEKVGNVDGADMFRTFNMGIGMAVVVKKAQRDEAMDFLEKSEYVSTFTEIGRVAAD